MPRKVEVIHEDHVEAEKDAAEARALVLGRGELSDRGRLEALIKPYVFDDVDAWGRGAEAVLRDYFEDLRRVFRFYAASGEAGSADEMSVHEWMVFLGDCRIIDKRHAWCFRRGSPDDADEPRDKFALFRFTKDAARQVFDMTLDAEDEARRLAAEERKRAYYEESLEEVRRVQARAAQESEIPNFKGSDLGHFPLVSADLWTSDHLLERSRSVVFFSPGTRARGTLTLKRR